MADGESIDWTFGAQSGTVTADAKGEVTIDGLALSSSASTYTDLVLTRSQAFGMVLTRAPRPNTPITIGADTIDDASNYVTATDVKRINQNFGETDVVYYPDVDDPLTYTVIWNCTGVATVCAAQEARVSPDGTKIAYSVGFGNALVNVPFIGGVDVGVDEINYLTSASIYIYDIQAGTSSIVPNQPAGTIDRQPEWVDNDTIVFTSTRGNTYPNKNVNGPNHTGFTQFGAKRGLGAADYGVSQEYGYIDPASKSMNVWKMDIDGTNAVNLTPHEDNALNPLVVTTGDIYYSAMNTHGLEVFPVAAPKWLPTSPRNLFWISRMNQHGGDHTVLLNGHKTQGNIKVNGWLPPHITGSNGTDSLRALRNIGEDAEGRLYVGHYYGANHRAGGSIYRVAPYADPSVEGCSTESCYTDNDVSGTTPGGARFVNSSLTNVAPYGNSQDAEERKYDDPDTVPVESIPVGKAGFMGPLPGGGKQYTHMGAHCYNAGGVVTPAEQNAAATGGQPICDSGIYRMLVDRVTDPFDETQIEAIIDSTTHFEWDADVVAPYQSIYGQAQPAQQTPYTPGNCYVQVVDMTKAELYFGDGATYDWNKLGYDCSVIGCAVGKSVANFHADNIDGLKFLKVDRWDVTWSAGNQDLFGGTLNNTGHKKYTNLGTQTMESDGSLKAQVPCDTPLIFQGVDSDGMAIAHDAMLQSLRPGETRTCHGCHDGHSEERYAALGNVTALSRWDSTLASATSPALLNGTESLTFNDDVLPILTSRCVSCHEAFDASDPHLYSKIAADDMQFDMPFASLRTGPFPGGSSIRHVRILNPGTGYQVGSALNFPSCTTNAAGYVSAVGPGGEIEAIALTSGGSGCPIQSAVGLPGSPGSGASLQGITDRYQLHRPYTSKWVSKFARDSLLYWKCRNQRMDGRTDGAYSNDIDFGADHPTDATLAECNIIGRWIDQGIPHYQDPTP
jgi:hypothetical protein